MTADASPWLCSGARSWPTTFAVGRRHACGDTLVVEWITDYGDGRVYRNVTVADLRDGHAIRVTDYWGEPFEAPAWRESLADALDMPPRGISPAVEVLQSDDESP